jgi:hypothetical protein
MWHRWLRGGYKTPVVEVQRLRKMTIAGLKLTHCPHEIVDFMVRLT